MSLAELTSPFNVAAYFVDRSLERGRAERVAFEYLPTLDGPSETVTYAQLHERVSRCGNALRALGVRREERVALLLLDSPAFAYAFFGAIKLGAVAVPLNTLLRPPEWEYMLNDTRARVVVVSAALLAKFQEIPRANLRYLEHILIDGVDAGDSPASHLGTSMSQASPVLTPEPLTPDDPAFWLYSSGSTGAPKGCVHLQHDMVVCAERYAQATLGIRPSDRCFSVAKLFFAYGLGNGLYFPLSVGATAILWPGAALAGNVYAIMERTRPTLFYSVPTNYSALLAHTRSGTDFDLSGVRWAVSAGEALPAALYQRFRERFGVEILDAIGSTECLHMFIANRPGAVRAGSSGQLIDGYEARILDDSGQPVREGEIGNLYIKSDATCAYYWNQHAKTQQTIQGEWIKTGDKYHLDAEGYYWYDGRSDDMLKVSGAWVSPVQIEAVLMEHPAVLEAAVVARDDAEKLTKPAAFVVLRDGHAGSDALANELCEFVGTKLAGIKKPRWVEFVSALPKTATGKIQRFKLRQG